MYEKLNALIQDCMAYINAFQTIHKEGKSTNEQIAYYKALKKLYPILEKAIQGNNEAPKVNSVSEFNDLYNKNFDYLNKFTAAPQNSIKHILQYQQLAQKMDQLYAGIPQKTLERQASLLKGRRKDVTKWLQAFEKMLQSTENQQALENRFLELLAKANQELQAKGLATVSISANTTHTT
jgi:hypothetical protein